jgi:hypothetical protein
MGMRQIQESEPVPAVDDAEDIARLQAEHDALGPNSIRSRRR